MPDPLLVDHAGADAHALVAGLTARGQTLATCESLTAGLLAGTLAGVPGASAVLLGGLITYTEATKIALAGVDPLVLATVGPVAAETAREMATGARQRCATTWGLGLTGVAGPEPHGGHAVGTVFLGLAGPDGCDAEELHLAGGRWEIRQASVHRAIVALLARIGDI
ncbi:competence protein [Mycobacterium sp. MS1601]|uniref:CinA family protein n=1 Tax=Mycobacterium sp. MS1601 TaxID=1936029 RepID=UPI000979464A|nr:CinA family protein [Mycobacterium sp. MS1601]AQA05870.1 competence protein [Mycobacterium sp. MS1601]